jgi:ABC-type transport system substrate-binding protein
LGKKKIAVLVAITVLILPLLVGITPARAQEPFFEVVLGAPTNNPARVAWAGIIKDSMVRAGIDAKLALGTWGVWIPRVFDFTPEMMGLPYSAGGWDIFFVGWTGGILVDPSYLYHSDNFPPPGGNYPLWDNSTNDDLIDNIVNDTDDASRRATIRQWQRAYLTESPKCTILYRTEAWAWDPNLEGFEDVWYIFPDSPAGDLLVRWPGGGGTVVVGQNADPIDWQWHQIQSYYDVVAVRGIYEALMNYDDNDAYFNFDRNANLLTGIPTATPDGLNWTMNLRQDVFWPHGFRFNASDVKYTFELLMTPDAVSDGYSFYADTLALTNDSIVVVDEFTVRVDFNYTYAYALDALNIHILSREAMRPTTQGGTIDWDDIPTHPSNTGDTAWNVTDVNGDPYQIWGPFGLGPYITTPSEHWDSTARAFTCIRRDTWAGASGTAGKLFNGTVVPYFNTYNGLRTTAMPETYVATTIASADAAITALQQGQIDIIDSQFSFEAKVGLIDPAWGTVGFKQDLGNQEMGFNMMHDVVGTGVNTPFGQEDIQEFGQTAGLLNSSRYARYVRQAINHLIPRQAIIDEILDGFGVPGKTYVPPLSGDDDPTLEGYTYDPAGAAALLAMAGYIAQPAPFDPTIILFAGVGIAVIAVVIAVIAVIRVRK